MTVRTGLSNFIVDGAVSPCPFGGDKPQHMVHVDNEDIIGVSHFFPGARRIDVVIEILTG